MMTVEQSLHATLPLCHPRMMDRKNNIKFQIHHHPVYPQKTRQQRTMCVWVMRTLFVSFSSYCRVHQDRFVSRTRQNIITTIAPDSSLNKHLYRATKSRWKLTQSKYMATQGISARHDLFQSAGSPWWVAAAHILRCFWEVQLDGKCGETKTNRLNWTSYPNKASLARTLPIAFCRLLSWRNTWHKEEPTYRRAVVWRDVKKI